VHAAKGKTVQHESDIKFGASIDAEPFAEAQDNVVHADVVDTSLVPRSLEEVDGRIVMADKDVVAN